MMGPNTRTLTVSGLLLVVYVGACLASKPTTSFAQYLDAKKGVTPAPSGKLQSSYEYVDVDHACLKEVSNKNCRDGGGLYYFESGVTCCDGRSNSGNSLGSSAIEVGTCKFKELYFFKGVGSDPIEEAAGVMKYGEFTVQCYLNSASDSCGGPFCDQMVLSAEGGIYMANDVVLASRPIAPIIDGSCSGGKRESKLGSGKPLKGKKTGKVAAKLTNDVSVSNSDASHSLYSGAAWIYFGPMTVNSRFYDVKVSQGWFEYVYDYIEGEPITDAEAEGKHVVDPFTYDLKFYKSQNKY